MSIAFLAAVCIFVHVSSFITISFIFTWLIDVPCNLYASNTNILNWKESNWIRNMQQFWCRRFLFWMLIYHHFNCLRGFWVTKLVELVSICHSEIVGIRIISIHWLEGFFSKLHFTSSVPLYSWILFFLTLLIALYCKYRYITLLLLILGTYKYFKRKVAEGREKAIRYSCWWIKLIRSLVRWVTCRLYCIIHFLLQLNHLSSCYKLVNVLTLYYLFRGYIEAIRELEQQLQTGAGKLKFDDIVVACGRLFYMHAFSPSPLLTVPLCFDFGIILLHYNQQRYNLKKKKNDI